MESEVVYLDYQATTPLENEVLKSITTALKDAWGNPSSNHTAGQKAKHVIDTSRLHVSRMISAESKDVIFNSGGTEGNNTVLYSAVQFFNEQKSIHEASNNAKKRVLPHIITSNVEHDLIENLLRYFQKEDIAEVTYVPVSRFTGRLEVDDVIDAIQSNTCLVTVMLANNETGIVMPVGEIVAAVKAASKTQQRILFHTDAGQALGKIPVDVNDLGVDYLTIVGHKIYGPRIGALYVRNLAEKKTPYFPLVHGGGQEGGHRSGTENTGMIAGLGKASELVCLHLTEYQRKQKTTRDYLERRLTEVFDKQVVFNVKHDGVARLPNICSISFLGQGLTGHAVLSQCSRVQASVGAACHASDTPRASPILLKSGIANDVAINAIRLSVGRHTTSGDIDLVVQNFKQAVDFLTSQCQSHVAVP